MKKILLVMALVAGSAVFAAEPAKGAVAVKDMDYGAAMASKKGNPMAVEWQNANKAELAKLDEAWAEKFLEGGKEAIDGLLAEVKPGYATDAMKATQIAYLSQYVMIAKGSNPKWKVWASNENPHRALWAARLLAFAEKSASVDVKQVFLDQLRWCGYPKQGAAIRKIKGDKAVTDFAAMVAAELESR